MAVFICANYETMVSEVASFARARYCDNLLSGGRCDFVEGMECPFAKKAGGRELDKVRLSLGQELQYCATVRRTVKLRDKGKVVMILNPVSGSSWKEAGDDPYGRTHFDFEIVDLLLKNSWDLEGMQRLSTPSSWEENP